MQSTHDEHAPRNDFERVFAGFAEPKEVVWVEARDHFFAGALEEVEEEAARLATLP